MADQNVVYSVHMSLETKRKLKLMAAFQGKSIKAVVDEALKLYMKKHTNMLKTIEKVLEDSKDNV